MLHPSTTSSRLRSRTARDGFTVPELLITFAIGAIVTAIATPAFSKARDRYSVRGARQELVATVEAARAAAVQRGRTSYFKVRGNTVLAVVDTAPPGGAVTGQYTVVADRPLDRGYNVVLTLATPADSQVTFDARGFANPRLGRMVRVRIVGRTFRDSVCLSNFGQLLPAGCVP